MRVGWLAALTALLLVARPRGTSPAAAEAEGLGALSVDIVVKVVVLGAPPDFVRALSHQVHALLGEARHLKGAAASSPHSFLLAPHPVPHVDQTLHIDVAAANAVLERAVLEAGRGEGPAAALERHHSSADLNTLYLLHPASGLRFARGPAEPSQRAWGSASASRRFLLAYLADFAEGDGPPRDEGARALEGAIMAIGSAVEAFSPPLPSARVRVSGAKPVLLTVLSGGAAGGAGLADELIHRFHAAKDSLQASGMALHLVARGATPADAPALYAALRLSTLRGGARGPVLDVGRFLEASRGPSLGEGAGKAALSVVVVDAESLFRDAEHSFSGGGRSLLAEGGSLIVAVRERGEGAGALFSRLWSSVLEEGWHAAGRGRLRLRDCRSVPWCHLLPDAAAPTALPPPAAPLPFFAAQAAARAALLQRLSRQAASGPRPPDPGVPEEWAPAERRRQDRRDLPAAERRRAEALRRAAAAVSANRFVEAHRQLRAAEAAAADGRRGEEWRWTVCGGAPPPRGGPPGSEAAPGALLLQVLAAICVGWLVGRIVSAAEREAAPRKG